MKISGTARVHRQGFTLIELMVSMAILSLLLVMFGTMINQMNQAWISGQQRMESFQNGRAILEMMARELAPAAISPGLQFVQNPATSGQLNLKVLLPVGPPATTQPANTDSLFWQRPSTPNAFGNMYETGYFLTTVAATTTTPVIPKKYELVRFNIAPNYVATSLTTQKDHGGATASANTSLYWIYDPPTAYNPVFANTTPWPEYTDAPWLTTLTAAQFQTAISVVSDGVIGFWVRCLDKNGTPIPWLYQSTLYNSTVPNKTLKFNSAAAFNPATLGGASFTYTSPPVTVFSGPSGVPSTPSGTVAANRLPSAVELTIITLDSRTLARNPTLPTLPIPPTSAGEQDIPNEITTYMATLAAPPYNIKTARVFSTTVRLINGTD